MFGVSGHLKFVGSLKENVIILDYSFLKFALVILILTAYLKYKFIKGLIMTLIALVKREKCIKVSQS